MADTYRHLSLAERQTIMGTRDRRMPVSRIAAELRRHPATICRELRRNYFYDVDAWYRGYFGRVAHQKASSRRIRGGKVNRDQKLAVHIAERLQRCWSPEQIVGRLRLENREPAAPADLAAHSTRKWSPCVCTGDELAYTVMGPLPVQRSVTYGKASHRNRPVGEQFQPGNGLL